VRKDTSSKSRQNMVLQTGLLGDGMSVDLEEFLWKYRREARVVKYVVRGFFKRKFGREIADLVVKVLDESFRDMEDIIEEDYEVDDLATIDAYIDQAIDDIFDNDYVYVEELEQGLLEIIEKNIRKALEKKTKGEK